MSTEVFTNWSSGARFTVICAEPEVWGATVQGSHGYGRNQQEALISALESLPGDWEPGQQELKTRYDLPGNEAPEESSEPGEYETKARTINYVLPGKFWEFLELGKKVHAMRELRVATGMSIVSARQVVEAITSTRVADAYKATPLADLPPGTIIKGTGRKAWTFEKITIYNWYAPGDETPYSNGYLDSIVGGDFEVVYVPGGES